MAIQMGPRIAVSFARLCNKRRMLACSPMRYELLIGLRYTRAKRRNHFISFISMISMCGIALGVAALIVVLSVMNGFQKELRTRILGVASHIQVHGLGRRSSRAGRRWRSRRRNIQK